jgi:hypothetical protein
MWLPKPLYELLPYLYVLIGLLVIGAAALFAHRVPGSSISFFVGLAIVVLGVVVWMKRRSARLDKASRETRQLELFDHSQSPR